MEKIVLVTVTIIILPSLFTWLIWNAFEIPANVMVGGTLFLFGFHSASHIVKTFWLEVKLKTLYCDGTWIYIHFCLAMKLIWTLTLQGNLICSFWVLLSDLWSHHNFYICKSMENTEVVQNLAWFYPFISWLLHLQVIQLSVMCFSFTSYWIPFVLPSCRHWPGTLSSHRWAISIYH